MLGEETTAFNIPYHYKAHATSTPTSCDHINDSRHCQVPWGARTPSGKDHYGGDHWRETVIVKVHAFTIFFYEFRNNFIFFYNANAMKLLQVPIMTMVISTEF